MKFILISLLFLGSSAFARVINHEVNITKGPYYVSVTNSAFNPLGPDFKSEGEALVYMDGLNLSVEFPRVNLFTLKTVADKDNYFYTPGTKDPKIRVGFEGEKLSWFFGRSRDWSVTIADELKETGLEATPFFKMSDRDIKSFASRVFAETEEGGLEGFKITRTPRAITVTADVMLIIEGQSDDPIKVGEATVTFQDVKGARTITVKADVEDHEVE